jgi:hypothetical protein
VPDSSVAECRGEFREEASSFRRLAETDYRLRASVPISQETAAPYHRLPALIQRLHRDDLKPQEAQDVSVTRAHLKQHWQSECNHVRSHADSVDVCRRSRRSFGRGSRWPTSASAILPGGSPLTDTGGGPTNGVWHPLRPRRGLRERLAEARRTARIDDQIVAGDRRAVVGHQEVHRGRYLLRSGHPAKSRGA